MHLENINNKINLKNKSFFLFSFSVNLYKNKSYFGIIFKEIYEKLINVFDNKHLHQRGVSETKYNFRVIPLYSHYESRLTKQQG